MKKKAIYIPTEEDIYKLQQVKNSNDINKVDIYSYLVAKTIEKLIVDLKFLRYDDIEVSGIPEIIRGICHVYPHEVYHSEYARYDADICHNMLRREKDQEVRKLDALNMFAPSVQMNRTTMSIVIDILAEKLKDDPQYRFIYSDSELLDAIFGVNYQEFISLTYSNKRKLIDIDPIYALKFDPRGLMPDINCPDERLINYRLGILFQEGMHAYKQRYDISEYAGYDYESEDFTNPKSDQVKKLIKYLHHK